MKEGTYKSLNETVVTEDKSRPSLLRAIQTLSLHILRRPGGSIPLSSDSCKHNMSPSCDARPVEEFRDEEYPQLKGTKDPSAAVD